MKKRILSVLLILTMLASMFVMPVSATEATATETEPAVTPSVGYCQHCQEEIPADKWLPWDEKNTGPRTGHYYLAEDIISQPNQITINLDDDLLRNEICLDLRGRTYTVTGLRPFLIYGIFSIMDTVGGGEIAVTGASNAHGAFAMMGKSSNSKDGSGELNIYSGTLRRINNDSYKVSYGGLIYAANGATLNVHGGKLIGGDVVPHLISKTNYAPLGGTIYCSGSNVNIYGGTITGGVSHSGTLYKYGSTTETQSFEGTGGNIYLEKSSKMLLTGGVIENGYADVRSGNVHVNASELTITGGTIRGGATAGASGNLEIGTNATLNMSGGYITGGTCRTRGGNLFVNTTTATLNISGGTIDGDMSVGLFKSFTLSGAPKILMGNGNGLRLQRATDANQKYDQVIDISGLTEGAVIYLDGDRHDPVFTTVLENPEAYLGYFKGAIRGEISVDESGALKVTQGNTGYCPHCWKSGEPATWTAFDNSTPSANLTVTSQHTYLTASASRTRLLIINTDIDYVFDTAGKTLTMNGYKFANLYGTLSILDSIGSGTITGTGHVQANGGVIMGSGTGVFNMYSGTLSRTIKNGEEGKLIFDGGVLYAPTGSAVNIYGGIIRDGIASVGYKNSPIQACGGNVYSAGTFRMEGGLLLNGQAVSSMGYVNDSAGNMTATDKLYVGSGGNLYVSGTATITGGHIVGGSAGYGGNVYATSNSLEITGGVIREGVVNDELNGNDWGGNIYYTGVKTATIENALIRGGSTPNLGGNINLYNTTLTVTDSLIAEGIAGIDKSDGRGGNIYVNGSSKIYLSGTTVSAGWAYNVGGNIYAITGSETYLRSGLITGGTAETGSGGSLYMNSFTMTGGRVVGGYTKSGTGGNIAIYTGEKNYLTIEDDGDAKTPAPVVAKGSSGKLGANIRIDAKARADISDALIYGGIGDLKNSAANFDCDNIYGNENSVLTLTNVTVSGIPAEFVSGSGVYAYGELILKGNTTVINEEKKSCVYIGSAGKLTVEGSFTGIASVAFESSHFADVNAPQGGTVAEKNTATGVFSGTLLLEGYSGRDYGLPAIFAEAGDSKLYVASVAVVDPIANTFSWFSSTEAAVNAVSSSTYVKLFASENTMEIREDVTVDLNGKNLTVTGAGTLYGFDSSNDDYEGFGTLTASESITLPHNFTAPNGNRYVTLSENTTHSFHRLGMQISGVTLRPSVAGMYFKSTWNCDAALSAAITGYGVAVSTANMPGMDFVSDADTLYTSVATGSFVSGQTQTSAIIENILSEGADNSTRGNTPIYAASYAMIGDTVIIGDDNSPVAGGVCYTMRQLLEKIDLIWPKLSENQQAQLKTLYALDPEAIGAWETYNLKAAVEGTASIRPLKILTIGHSLAVDSAHMLNLVAHAEGFDQEMVIGTLYYSGCPLYKHVNYLTQNASVYQLYLSNSTTPEKPPVILKGFSMKDAIVYDDWDIIIMQGGVFEIAEDVTYQDGNIQIIQNYVNQYKTNPDAVFAWHMPWALPTDNTLRDMYPYSPNTYYTNYTKYNDDRTTLYTSITGAVGRNIVTDDSFVYLIPSGTAIENALSSYLVESDLHRDYAHTTDLGRLIAAYTWYCTLTGVDQLDEINVDVIPVAFFKSTTGTTDRVLTDMEKAIILESVNNALSHPLEMTQSQYTVAP